MLWVCMWYSVLPVVDSGQLSTSEEQTGVAAWKLSSSIHILAI